MHSNKNWFTLTPRHPSCIHLNQQNNNNSKKNEEESNNHTPLASATWLRGFFQPSTTKTTSPSITPLHYDALIAHMFGMLRETGKGHNKFALLAQSQPNSAITWREQTCATVLSHTPRLCTACRLHCKLLFWTEESKQIERGKLFPVCSPMHSVCNQLWPWKGSLPRMHSFRPVRDWDIVRSYRSDNSSLEVWNRKV